MLDVLAEVGARCFAKAVDGETAALAQVDLVGVHLEELLFVEAVLELEGDHDLDNLALDFFSGERKKPRASCMVSVDPPCCLCPVRTSLTPA